MNIHISPRQYVYISLTWDLAQLIGMHLSPEIIRFLWCYTVILFCYIGNQASVGLNFNQNSGFLECKKGNILVIPWALVFCLLYIYTWAWGLQARGQVCIYQAKHSCPWYNYYIYQQQWVRIYHGIIKVNSLKKGLAQSLVDILHTLSFSRSLNFIPTVKMVQNIVHPGYSYGKFLLM